MCVFMCRWVHIMDGGNWEFEGGDKHAILVIVCFCNCCNSYTEM